MPSVSETRQEPPLWQRLWQSETEVSQRAPDQVGGQVHFNGGGVSCKPGNCGATVHKP